MLSRVPIPCPECHQTIKVRTEYIGLRVQCNRCRHPFAVPRKLPVACPECGLGEMFRTENLGRVIRCNHCDAVYEALVGDGARGPSDRPRAASETGERREMSDPPQADGLNSAKVSHHAPDMVDSDDGGRSTRPTALEAWRDERASSDAVDATGGTGPTGRSDRD